MRHTQPFLYAKSIKDWFYFPVNFAKFLRTPFLQNTSGWLFLLRLKCFPHHFHGLSGICLTNLYIWNNTTATTAENLKFYSKWAEYLLSTSACQNWLLICETPNKWHICKSAYMELSGGKINYFETLDWFLYPPPSPPKKNQSREIMLFLKTRNKLMNEFFPKLCLHYIYLD